VVEEAGEDFEGDGVLQVSGRDAAGMRDDFGIMDNLSRRLQPRARASLSRRTAEVGAE
jgi:hypothetical protein